MNDGRAAGVATYADAIAPVQKAVVSVYSTILIHRPRSANPLFPLTEENSGDAKERGLGSGVIVSKNGYIITNNHVVEGADELNVQLTDGRELKARVIGTDSKTDVAVIKIDADQLPTVILADSDKLRVGDVVFAVGNPLGVGQTVTMGIVSATGREVHLLDDVQGYEDFIQTDAAINQGNSGGALIDAKGRLIGINSAILSTSRGNIGIGFAIPVNLAASIMQSLLENGSVARGFLGVEVDALTPDVAEALGLRPETRGAIVSNIIKDGPAEKAGLKRGDVILSINGKPVSSRQELRLAVAQLHPKADAVFNLIHDRQPVVIKVQLGDLAQTVVDALLPGVHAIRLTEDVKRDKAVDSRVDAGLLITAVDADSPYADRLQPNMVIVEINRIAATDLDSARRALIPGKNLLLVNLHGTAKYLSIPYGAR